MAIEIELPDGRVAEFPDGTPQDVMKSALADLYRQEGKPSKESDALHGLSLGTRNVLQGLGSVPAMLLNQPINAIGQLFGYDPGLGNPGEALSDWLGLAKPETDAERLRSTIIEGASGTLPFIGAGMGMQGARLLPQAVQEAGKTLATAPFLQIAGDAAASGAGEMARQQGEGPAGQLAASLAAGMGPGMAAGGGNLAKRALSGVVTGIDALTTSGQKKIAGATLRRMATDPENLETTIRQNLEGAELVQGSSPTLAQLTQDSGIAGLERSLKDSDPARGGQITRRYSEQDAARQEQLEDIYGMADARIAEMRARANLDARALDTADAQSTGRQIRDTRSRLDREFRDSQVTPAYASIDPERRSAFLVSPVLEKANAVLARYFGEGAGLPNSEIRSIVSELETMVREGRTVPYDVLQNWRSRLREIAGKAKRAGENRDAAVAGELRASIDDYIMQGANSPDLIGVVPYPSTSSRRYRNATGEARRAVASDPLYDDLEYMYREGLNRDWLTREFGEVAAIELNRLYPGLVRKNGKFIPDVSSADLLTPGVQSDGQALYEMLLDRLPTRKSRRAAEAEMRDTILSENVAPHTGFSPEQAAAYRRANDLYRQQQELFRKGPNEGLARGRDIADSAIPSLYFRSGKGGKEAIQTFMRGIGQDPDAVAALRSWALTEASRAAVRNGRADAGKLQQWMEKYADAINGLPGLREQLTEVLQRARLAENAEKGFRKAFRSTEPGKIVLNRHGVGNDRIEWQQGGTLRDQLEASGAFTGEELETLMRVEQDLNRAKRAENLASTAGSPTAKNLATQHILDRALGGDVGRAGKNSDSNLLARLFLHAPANFFGDKARSLLYGSADSAVRDYLTAAMLDPETALDLLRRGRMKSVPAIGSVLAHTGTGMGMTGLRSLLDYFADEGNKYANQ